MSVDRIAVIGGGAWGTALAQVASDGKPVLLWARESEVVDSINTSHENSLFLPGLKLDPTIRATGNLAEVADCDAWLVVTPAQHMRSVLEAAPASSAPMVLCSKGIEERSGELLHRVASEVRARRDPQRVRTYLQVRGRWRVREEARRVGCSRPLVELSLQAVSEPSHLLRLSMSGGSVWRLSAHLKYRGPESLASSDTLSID